MLEKHAHNTGSIFIPNLTTIYQAFDHRSASILLVLRHHWPAQPARIWPVLDYTQSAPDCICSQHSVIFQPTFCWYLASLYSTRSSFFQKIASMQTTFRYSVINLLGFSQHGPALSRHSVSFLPVHSQCWQAFTQHSVRILSARAILASSQLILSKHEMEFGSIFSHVGPAFNQHWSTCTICRCSASVQSAFCEYLARINSIKARFPLLQY